MSESTEEPRKRLAVAVEDLEIDVPLPVRDADFYSVGYTEPDEFLIPDFTRTLSSRPRVPPPSWMGSGVWEDLRSYTLAKQIPLTETMRRAVAALLREEGVR